VGSGEGSVTDRWKGKVEVGRRKEKGRREKKSAAYRSTSVIVAVSRFLDATYIYIYIYIRIRQQCIKRKPFAKEYIRRRGTRGEGERKRVISRVYALGEWLGRVKETRDREGSCGGKGGRAGTRKLGEMIGGGEE